MEILKSVEIKCHPGADREFVGPWANTAIIYEYFLESKKSYRVDDPSSSKRKDKIQMLPALWSIFFSQYYLLFSWKKNWREGA